MTAFILVQFRDGHKELKLANTALRLCLHEKLFELPNGVEIRADTEEERYDWELIIREINLLKHRTPHGKYGALKDRLTSMNQELLIVLESGFFKQNYNKPSYQDEICRWLKSEQEEYVESRSRFIRDYPELETMLVRVQTFADETIKRRLREIRASGDEYLLTDGNANYWLPQEKEITA